MEEEERIHNLHYDTTITPSQIYLPKDFFPFSAYDRGLEENPYKGTFGNPHWDFIAVQVLWYSKHISVEWVGVEGFSYTAQGKEVKGMIEAGWLRTLPMAGYALTKAAIEKLLARSREISDQH